MAEAIDWVFRDVLLIDGTGAPGRPATVTVTGDRIASIDPSDAVPPPAERVVSGHGRILAPGFIDVHSHSDFAVLLYPRAESKLYSGVTTEIDGNCGMSAFPLRGELREHRQGQYRSDGLTLDWEDASGYLQRVAQAGTSINHGSLVGHGNVRAVVMGYGDGSATRDQVEAMAREVDHAMAQGALGLSSGLVYPPGRFADTDELGALATVVARHGGYYTSHIRNEGDGLESAVEEFLAVAERAGVRAQLSHVKTSGRANWPKIGWLRETLFAARRRGLDLNCDRYPYTASQTGLDTYLLPGWAQEGGVDAELGRLTDAPTRARLRQALLDDYPPADDYWDRLRVSSVKTDANRWCEGQTLRAIAERAGKDPIEAGLDLIVSERAQAAAIRFSMSDDNLREILRWPFTSVGSDSSLKAPPATAQGGRPHPRGFGTPARVLAHYVRELGVLSWESAIHKMSGLPARMAGLAGRGTIQPGHFADLVLFDPDAVEERATYEEPRQLSAGMDLVLVNGTAVLESGEHTGATPGRMLRRADA